MSNVTIGLLRVSLTKQRRRDPTGHMSAEVRVLTSSFTGLMIAFLRTGSNCQMQPQPM